MIYIEHSFLDDETCLKLQEFASAWCWADSPDEFWSKRVLPFGEIHEPIASITNGIKQRIAGYIQGKYHDRAHCDTIDLVRWQDGKEMPPHRDAMDVYMYRDWGSVLYLNDDYEGGHTYYPELNIDVKPKAGSLVVHEGDALHGVKPVEGNTRYTIASFWTKDKKKATYDRLH
jgi:hypothetical protein